MKLYEYRNGFSTCLQKQFSVERNSIPLKPCSESLLPGLSYLNKKRRINFSRTTRHVVIQSGLFDILHDGLNRVRKSANQAIQNGARFLSSENSNESKGVTALSDDKKPTENKKDQRKKNFNRHPGDPPPWKEVLFISGMLFAAFHYLYWRIPTWKELNHPKKANNTSAVVIGSQSVPFSLFLKEVEKKNVSFVEVDGHKIKFVVKQVDKDLGFPPNVEGYKGLELTTFRPKDLPTPYKLFVDKEVEFGTPDRQFLKFLNSLSVLLFVFPEKQHFLCTFLDFCQLCVHLRWVCSMLELLSFLPADFPFKCLRFVLFWVNFKA